MPHSVSKVADVRVELRNTHWIHSMRAGCWCEFLVVVHFSNGERT